MRDILADLTQTIENGRPCVYCSVVETRGSTPQKAGAAMMVHADGGQSGTLGGGCVEAEVKRRALAILNTPEAEPEILRFTLDDDYGWDDGLICGGRMTMLVAPLRIDVEVREPYYLRYLELIESGEGCTEVVALERHEPDVAAGSRYLFDSAGTLIAQIGRGSAPIAMLDGLKPLADRPRPSVKNGFAFLPELPRITLFIVGGGHVGQAVASLGASVDFDIWVLDDREKYASRERFPAAQKVLVGDIGRTLQELAPSIHRGMYCLVITRGHNHDEEALYHLARVNAGYVGMIGSKRKIKMIFEDLIAKGISEEVLAKVHAPLGIPIASRTVPEIAISIVAELIQIRNGGGKSSRP